MTRSGSSCGCPAFCCLNVDTPRRGFCDTVQHGRTECEIKSAPPKGSCRKDGERAGASSMKDFFPTTSAHLRVRTRANI